MEKANAQNIFRKYASAMAYVVVENPDGDESIGSAFHVGEGVLVTARHVVDGFTVKEVRISEPVPVTTREFLPDAPDDYDEKVREVLGFVPRWKHYQHALKLVRPPMFHNDSRLDVAALLVEGVHPHTAFVPLGSHLDDWIENQDWILSEAIVLGYPPIPFTLQPELVGARAEVNAVIVPRDAPKVHFILSAVPRGGFSGGLVLSEHDFVLGLVSRSLLRDHQPEELGFFSVLSVESIFECLATHKLLPEVQKSRWGDFWNTETTVFLERGSAGGGRQVAYVSYHDDGKKLFIDIWAEEPKLFADALERARDKLNPDWYTEGPGVGSSVRLLLLEVGENPKTSLLHAREAGEQVLISGGLFKLARLGIR